MTNPTKGVVDAELDSEFLKKFRLLKQLRNSHQMDEPDFDDRVEQLAADTYAHPTREGWCCACDADIAFAAQDVQQEPEFKALIKAQLEALLAETTNTFIAPGHGVPVEVIKKHMEALK